MSWEAVIFFPGVSLSPLQLVGLIIAALAGLMLVAAAVMNRRKRATRDFEPESAHENGAQTDSGTESETDTETDTETLALESLDDDDYLKRAFSAHTHDPDIDEIPSFTSLPHDTEGGGRSETAAARPTTASAGDVSSLLFRLLGTKARILELERAERTKTHVLTSTCQALESLKESLDGSSSELRDEIDEMHELITGELSASHQSSESVQQLKEIIEAQYDLLNKPGAVYSAELLLAKQSYVETIDASLDRRLKNAERRETEFALGKERIMALKKQMVRLKDSEPDSTRAH